MELKIIHMHENMLHETTQPLDIEHILDDDIQTNLQNMLDMYPTLPAVGLAAPQVGWPVRAFLIGIEDEHSRGDQSGVPLTLYINPEYEVISEETETDWEGCFSVYNEPEQQMLGEVTRPTAIRLHAYDKQGNAFSEEYQGFRARVFQHECDHLNGVRYVNRMKNNQRLSFRQDFKDYTVYMHQVPKALRSNKYPVLRDLVPMLEHAPQNGISKKLLKEIVTVYHATEKK